MTNNNLSVCGKHVAGELVGRAVGELAAVDVDHDRELLGHLAEGLVDIVKDRWMNT